MIRLMQGVLAGLGMLLLVTQPAVAVDKAAIDAAIERGVNFVKSQQLQDGTWHHSHRAGATALCALALLECSVPVDDPSILKAARAVRQEMVTSNHVYSISLAILFLDRLGDPDDVPLIESLGVRLLEGQKLVGSWSYTTPAPDAGETRRLTAVAAQAGAEGKQRVKRGEGEKRSEKDLAPEVQQQLQQLNARRARAEDGISAGDNSNTQFAILGLWVARRHGVPVDRALRDCENYFRKSQNPDGGWGYVISMAPGGGAGFGLPMAGMAGAPQGMGGGLVPGGLPLQSIGGSSGPMTCAGLLGLGLAYGAWQEAGLRTDPKAPDRGRPGPAAPAPAARDPNKDVNVQAALRALAASVSNPGGKPIDLGGGRGARPGVPVPPGGGAVPPPLPFGRPGGANGKAYYFLWSLERVAVAFDLDTLGKKDWYGWGAEILLANQDLNGGWTNGEYPEGCCDSAFALLFLKRANLLGDLTRSLKGRIKDPGKATLAAGGIGGAELLKKGVPPSEGTEPRTTPDSGSRPKTATAPPAANANTPEGRLAAQLVDGSAARQEEALEKLRDGRGAEYTDALAAAIPKLSGKVKAKAREALAERLSRMKAATLADKLSDEDLEVRRAAAIACAMKEDLSNVEKIIALLDDPEPPVARAAHAALKSLSNQDFGPSEDATRAEKARAIAAWKEWWQKQKK